MKTLYRPLRVLALSLALAGGVFLASCSSAGKPGGMNQRHPHFDALDIDHDGSLNYAEFMKSKWAQDSKAPREVFNRLDTNKNGTISRIEMQEYLRRKKSPDPMKRAPHMQPPGLMGTR